MTVDSNMADDVNGAVRNPSASTPPRLIVGISGASGVAYGVRTLEALRELGFVNDTAVANTIARQLRIPFIDFSKIVVDPEVAQIIPEAVSRKYKVLALMGVIGSEVPLSATLTSRVE